ncbi:MAG: sterol desaturase [Hyphococcus sp.]|nr:MAG: sterol desaturase [Marinicaulis sp.]
MEFFDWFMGAVAERAPQTLRIEGIRYLTGTILVFLMVWVLFERPLRNRKIRKGTPRTKQIRREIAYSALSVVVFMFMGVFVYEGAAGGWFKFYSDVGQYGWAYLAFSIVALALFHDAYFYWTHRLIHHPKLFRYFHATHHRSHNPTPFTAYSFDPGEAAVNYMFIPVFAFFVPLHDIATIIYMWLMIVRNAAGHSGYELMPKSWARHPILGALTSVTHHDMHHEKMTGNYALYFTWWDRLMGTEHSHYMERFDKAVGNETPQGETVAVPTPAPAPARSLAQ